ARASDVGPVTPPVTPPAAAASAPVVLSSDRLKGDPTLEAIARGEATLARGARGPAVKAVQQALVDLGVPVAGGADGSFGNGTSSAVALFQRQKGLAASGVVDQATLGAIDHALAALAPGGTGSTGGPPAAGTLNARFASDPTLQKV